MNNRTFLILVQSISNKSIRQCHTKRMGSKIESNSFITSPPSVTSEYKSEFQKRGFSIIPSLIPKETCDILNERLEQVFLGNYSTGNNPDKAPVIKEKNRGVYRQQNHKTLQIINIWKSDSDFQDVVLCSKLGEYVANLMGWSGARVAQDQVWAKPPMSSALVFHRDSPYFDFEPADVLTVWIALDDMDQEVGPLQYVYGSHKWADFRSGSANQFFSKSDNKDLLFDAALKSGNDPEELIFETVGVRAGGAGVHNGRTWHGSGKNESSTRPRRGIGIHFVPADATFKEDLDEKFGKEGRGGMWKKLQDKYGGLTNLPDNDMPVTWTRNNL